MTHCLNFPHFADTDEEDDLGLTFEQRSAMKHSREVQAKKHVADRATRNSAHRKRKEPIPPQANGIRGAILEWVRALLGVPRSAPVCNSTQPSIESMLEQHLPEPPTSFEIDTWANYDTRRRAYLDAAAKSKIDNLLARNPKATEKVQQVVSEMAIKEAIEKFRKTNPPVKFVSRLRQNTSSSNSYSSHWLSLGETALSQAGFPRCTFIWTSPITTVWNSTISNVLLATWLQCLDARQIPPGYFVDTSLDVAKWAREILIGWVFNKRSLFRQEGKQKALAGSQAGSQVLIETSKERREKASLKRMKAKVQFFSYQI